MALSVALDSWAVLAWLNGDPEIKAVDGLEICYVGR
jgi:hypothetical protein